MTVDPAQIVKAVGQVITNSGTFPRVVWANKGDAPARPYLVVEVVPALVTDPTIKKVNPRWQGFLSARVVTALDEYETAGQGLAKSLGDLFPAASRLTLDDGSKIVIADHPQPLPPFRTDADYNHPVRVPLQAADA